MGHRWVKHLKFVKGVRIHEASNSIERITNIHSPTSRWTTFGRDLSNEGSYVQI